MDKNPRRVVHTTTIIRHEMDGPPGQGIDRKHWGFLFNTFLADFTRVKGREPEWDNDWWVEPTDDGVAICYKHDKKVESAPDRDSPSSAALS